MSQEHHTQANPFEQAAPQMSHVQAIKEPPTGAKRIALLVVLLLVLGLGGAIAVALSSATADSRRGWRRSAPQPRRRPMQRPIAKSCIRCLRR